MVFGDEVFLAGVFSVNFVSSAPFVIFIRVHKLDVRFSRNKLDLGRVTVGVEREQSLKRIMKFHLPVHWT